MHNLQTFFPVLLLCLDYKCIFPHSKTSLLLLACLSLWLCYYLEIYAANKSLVFREVGRLFKTNSSVICNLAFPKSGNYGRACEPSGS